MEARMKNSYGISIPFPPSVNHYWRRSGQTMHISAAGKAFKAEVAKQIADGIGEVDVLTGRIGIQIELFRGDRREYDIDNYPKSVLDALKGVLFQDDRQVDWLVVKRREVTPPGFCEVIVSELA